MIKGFAPLFRSIDEDLERFFDALLPDVLPEPSRTQATLDRYILDELLRRYRTFRPLLGKPKAAANGGICYWNHAGSIAERLELLFALLQIGDEVRDPVSHRVAPTAELADERTSIEPERAAVHRTG